VILDFGFWILDWTRSTGIFQNRKNCNPFPRLIWKRYTSIWIPYLVPEPLQSQARSLITSCPAYVKKLEA
jgi:hypothetical protein